MPHDNNPDNPDSGDTSTIDGRIPSIVITGVGELNTPEALSTMSALLMSLTDKLSTVEGDATLCPQAHIKVALAFHQLSLCSLELESAAYIQSAALASLSAECSHSRNH